MARHLGLDFGTTNSALAVAEAGANSARLARFSDGEGRTETFRSVLWFDPQGAGPGQVETRAGPEAIRRYLSAGGSGRLLQSLKSYLASGLFQSTQVYGRTYSLEDLATVLLRHLRAGAEADLGPLGGPGARLVVGRPVRFANSDGEADEALALSRLRKALAQAGFEAPVFEYEPVGAAWFYESTLDHDELVLIGDFGGGTSDFCLMRVGPGARRRASSARILGTEGVGLAGDAFDGRVVDHAVAPALGKGSAFRSYMGGKLLPVPPWPYAKLRRWHHLSFLKSPETLRFLRDVRATALRPEAIDGLLHLVEHDLGYALYSAVEGAKVALSRAPEVQFTFRDGPVQLGSAVPRALFEAWIAEELTALERCVDKLLERAGVGSRDVDRVFLTGGSSLVPSVRAVFARRFGEGKLRAGHELTSVALGLALRARDLEG
ncbi:MAG: Hsp70 family protein [Deltaproteobacteria bacterium]|nr:Hsp70 family protein [Deltaproteobacteria bacterium]